MINNEHKQNKAALHAIGGRNERSPLAVAIRNNISKIAIAGALIIGIGAEAISLDKPLHSSTEVPAFGLINPTPSLYGRNVNKIIVSSPNSKRPGQVIDGVLGAGDTLSDISFNILKDTPHSGEIPQSAIDAVANQEMKATNTGGTVDGWMEAGQHFSFKISPETDFKALAAQEALDGTILTRGK